jgi:pyrroline-5-carboxylate reductase
MLGFIGFGNMGRAIAEALIKTQKVKKEKLLISVKSEKSKRKLSEEGFKVLPTEEVIKQSDIVFLAVKPNQVGEILKNYRPLFEGKTLITVVAGLLISFYKDLLGNNVAIVRTMPNVNVKNGYGVVGVSFSKNVKNKAEILELLKPLGLILEIDEKLMDAITALAGSGPAFVAEIIDAYAEAGVRLGFKYNEALKIALYTFLGTIKNLLEENKHPILLRDEVTSPGGTTIAGLKTLNEEAIKGKLIKVVESAYLRSQELKKG